jgi:hypothetical protein
MKKNFAVLGVSVASFLMPVVVFAQDLAAQCAVVGGGTLDSFACRIYSIVRIVIPLLILIAVAVFIYGVFNFIKSEGDDKAKGKIQMMNGIIGFAVILGLWGLVSILLNTFGVGGGSVNQGAFPTF